VIGGGLLVSVRDGDEARVALRGGADIVDLKEPRNGALGCAGPAAAASVARAVGRAVPWTAALGELEDGLAAVRYRLAAIIAAGQSSAAPPAAVKVGLAGLAGHDWEAALTDLFATIPAPTTAVLVTYADWDEAAAPHPRDVIAAAPRLGARWLLIDTAVKGRGSVLGRPSGAVGEAGGMPGGTSGGAAGPTDGMLADWIAVGRRQGLSVAVAGSLSLDELPLARGLGADVIGLRTAVCSGGRFGRVTEDRVRRAAAAVGRPGGWRAMIAGGATTGGACR